MTITRVKVKRTAAGEDSAAWAKALEDPAWLAAAEVLKDEPGSSWVRRARLMGRDVVVKCRVLNTVGRRLKLLLQEEHARRQWRGAEMIRSQGELAARPLAWGHCQFDGPEADFIVSEFVSGPTLLELMADAARGEGIGTREQHRLAAELGRQVAAITGGRYRYWNRDHKPSNLVVSRRADGSLGAVVVDCVGVREGSMRLSEAPWSRMFASLYIEPLGCGVPPRRTLAMRAIREYVRVSANNPARKAERRLVRDCWTATRARIDRHGDPRPKVNPLQAQRSPQPPPSGRGG